MDRVVAGRYQLREQLGSGGMGTVWRADDLLLGREVAVKEVSFPPGIAASDAEDLRERTRREARAAARLNHPNAVTVFDVVEEDGRPWLVMELVPARTLAQTVAADGPLSVQRTAAVGLAVLGALQAAHRLGIVHRDVKPSNILLAPAIDGLPERVVLTDFGIATTTGEESLTGTGLLLGSPAYIAPERVRGRNPGPPADLWSLGATMFTAVEGRPPFDQSEPMLTVSAVVRDQHAPYILAGPLTPVIDGLLQKDPGVRLTAIQTRALLQPLADRQVAAPDPAADAPTVVLRRGAGGTAGLSGRTAVLQLDQVQRQLARPEPVPVRRRQPPRSEVPQPETPRQQPRQRQPLQPDVQGSGSRQPAAPPRRAVPAPPTVQPAPVRGGRGPGAVVAAGLLALAIAAGGGWARLHSGGGSTSARTGATGTASPTASPTAASGRAAGAGVGTGAGVGAGGGRSPSGAASLGPGASTGTTGPGGGAAPAGQVPAGWATRPDPAGWVAAVPATYLTGTYRGFPQYRDPATGRTLRVSTGQGQPDAVADRRSQARAFAARHASYHEIGIRPVRYKGYPAADWEFTYEGLHVLNRVVNIDGRGYSLFFQTRESDFPAALPTAQAMFASFAPAQG